jgi:hypothetical protein
MTVASTESHPVADAAGSAPVAVKARAGVRRFVTTSVTFVAGLLLVLWAVDALLGVTPYSAPLTRVAAVRSAGITDLRYGNVLDEDWQGIDRFHDAGDHRHPFPLPEPVRCLAIAASKEKTGKHFGDGLVSVDSALGLCAGPAHAPLFPNCGQWVGEGLNHWDLLSDPTVYRRIREEFAS